MKRYFLIRTSDNEWSSSYKKICDTLEEAKNALPAGTEIVYLGWLMASFVSGYNKASKLISVRAVTIKRASFFQSAPFVAFVWGKADRR